MHGSLGVSLVRLHQSIPPMALSRALQDRPLGLVGDGDRSLMGHSHRDHASVHNCFVLSFSVRSVNSAKSCTRIVGGTSKAGNAALP